MVEYSEDMPNDVTPNEVGSLIFDASADEPHRGLIIITENMEAVPMHIDIIPYEIRDEYSFVLTINPIMAHFISAFQHHLNDDPVGDTDLAAGRLVWWLMIENARRMWKELEDANE